MVVKGKWYNLPGHQCVSGLETQESRVILTHFSLFCFFFLLHFQILKKGTEHVRASAPLFHLFCPHLLCLSLHQSVVLSFSVSLPPLFFPKFLPPPQLHFIVCYAAFVCLCQAVFLTLDLSVCFSLSVLAYLSLLSLIHI